ncbi:retrovirus-related pol polyprotein from transposon TNT 1-94 [Tanacetum coccineum]
MQHVNTEILKENQNLRNELKEITSIIETWLNNSNKVNQCISEQIPIQKKKILGIDQLTEDTSSSGPKDPVFVKSSADNSEVSITGSNKPKLSEAEDSTMSNHDTGKTSQHHTGQGESSLGSRPSRSVISFPSCIHCGYNDHQYDECVYYPRFYQMKVKSEFLNGKLKEEVYLKQPLGFEKSEFPNHVCTLDKALYGLKQAPRTWYETLSIYLTENNFIEQSKKGISINKERYFKDLLKKYDKIGSSMNTPIVPLNMLRPDLNGKAINET